MPLKVKPPVEPDKIISEFFRAMNKKRWSEVSTTERSRIMSELVKKRWKKLNKKQRSEYLVKIGFAGVHKPKKVKTSADGTKTPPKGL